jgi:NAD(P)-dependent dehydrogenase (short-subunit alcohol dehydrogenase family)
MAMKAFALRLAPEGIAVFEVRPGIIRTDMTAPVAGRYDEAIAGGLVPARRWGEAADVARIVASLASGQFAFATGSVVAADGGLSLPRL